MSALFEPERLDESGEDDPLLVEWAAELADRIRTGETVDWEELAARHPERAEALQRMLPAFALMARLGNSVHGEAARRDPIPDHPLAELGCLGDYRLLREVGRGGMGVVYEGHQISLKRRVALKVLPFASAIDARQCQRFQIEAQAAAALHHANIVPVFAVGTERGVPFYAMQFIEGRSLAVVIHELRQLDGLEPAGPAPACALTRSLIAGEFAPTPEVGTDVDRHGTTIEPAPSHPAAPAPMSSGSSARRRGYIRTVAALGLQAALAVEHAHRHGILHRDIKPSNLLVDEVGHLWVTDFGLARVPGESNLTLTGDVLGTLRYMSPEQALGKRVMLDGRSDVYSLGATLYELLTLRPAFGGDDRAEILRRIAQQEPRPPRRLNPAIPAAFETIVLKAMANEPARRYASAEALRDDLQRFLDNRPILGRPVSAWGRSRSWARRRPAVAALLGVIVFMACGFVGGIAAWISWLEWHNRQLEVHVARADQQTREAARQTGIAEGRRRLADRHHYAESLRLAGRALDERQIELAQDILHDIQPDPDGSDPRGFAWRYLWREANRDFSQLWGHRGRLLGGVVSPDGRLVATVDLSGKILIWDLADGVGHDRPVAEVSTRFPEWTTTRFSSDGRFLAFGQVYVDGPAQGIHVFDRLAGRSPVQVELRAGESVSSLSFDDRRKLLVFTTRGPDGFSVRFYELANLTAKPQTRFLGPSSCKPSLSLDGRVVCVANRGGIELADTETGRVLVHLADVPAEPLSPAKFSPDGRFVARECGCRILVWETEGGRRIGHAAVEGGIVALEWSLRGRFLAWGAEDGRLAILEPASGRVTELLSASTTQKIRFPGLSFSSDERLLAVSTGWVPGGPRPAEVWDLDRGRKIWEFPGRNEGGSVCFVPGGHDLLVTASSGPRVCRLLPKAEPDALGGHLAEAWAAAFAPDGHVLATGSDDTDERQTIKLWDAASGKLRAGWKGHTATVAALAFSPDGRLLASGSLDSGQLGHPNLVLWDARSYQRDTILPGHSVGVRSVAFSPDGRLLATASDDGTARLWDVAEKKTRAILEGHATQVNSIVFSPDGRLVATGSHDATVRLWDVATGRAVATLSDDGNVFAVAFSPDGSQLASANEGGAIKLWDHSKGALVRTIRCDSELLRCLAFTSDGRNIVAAGKGKVVRIWDVATGQELLSLEGHQAPINALAFSPDGSILASCDHQGEVKLWRAEPIETVPVR